MAIRLCFGAAGTGKTTWIERQAVRAHETGNYHARDFLFSSFTRASARVIADRISRNSKLHIGDNQVGTMHSFCFHELGKPKVAETFISKSKDELIVPFNKAVDPAYQLTIESKDNFDEVTGEYFGKSEADKAFQRMQYNRARRIPKTLWGLTEQHLWDRWSWWMNKYFLTDFTGMIEKCIDLGMTVPNDARVGFIDEAQDLTPLMLELALQWAEDMETCIFAGDPNQCIYSFTGSTPEAFLIDVPEDHKHILPRSWRMWATINDNARNWINRAATTFPNEVRPDQDGGEVVRLGYTYLLPDLAIRDMASEIQDDKNVMYLASTSYMLDPVKKRLREQGIPFHNPYRRARGDWNPLYGGKGTSTPERICAFLQPVYDENYGWGWTGEQVYKWTKDLKQKGVLQRGAKTNIIPKLPQDRILDLWELMDVFTDEAIGEFSTGDGSLNVTQDIHGNWVPTVSIDWLLHRLIGTKSKVYEYPSRVYKEYGIEGLKKEPQIIIGTVHSVKGGECDVAYVVPDLSPAAHEEWLAGGERKDSVYRLFYVALTRASEKVVVGQPISPVSVEGLVSIG